MASKVDMMATIPNSSINSTGLPGHPMFSILSHPRACAYTAPSETPHYSLHS